MKKVLCMFGLLTIGSSVYAAGGSQQAYDGDDGIHHPNSTAISYSAHKKAVRDYGPSPTAYQEKLAYDALAQKPGTLVYKYEQSQRQSN